MNPVPSGARFFLALVTLFVPCLLASCSRINTTQEPEITEFPATQSPRLSPTTEPTFVPITREQQPTIIVRTPLPVQDPTLTPTLAPSDTSFPTETPFPTFTPTAPVLWGTGVPVPAIIENFIGSWITLQQAMAGNLLEAPDSGSISLSRAPRYAVEAVSPSSPPVLGSEVTTSPSGRWILFGAVALDDFDDDWNELSTLTRLNFQDGRMQTFLPDLGSLRLVSFPGWLNGNIAALSDYAGGGFYNYSLVDVANHTLISSVRAHGPAWQPNSAFLPVAEEYGGPYRLFVLSRAAQSESFDTLLGPNPYTVGFPSEYIAPEMNTVFKDWLPDSNIMLVQAFVFNRSTSAVTHSQLMLWSVDSNIVQVVVQAAIDGKFSPDGKQLAYVSQGPSPLTADGQPSFDLGPQVPPLNQAYLQLMDFSTHRVSFSFPVITTLDRSMSYTVDMHEAPLDFSPDSRFLAFLTPGLLLTDQTGKLIVLPISQESYPFLSVIDLSSFQPILSTPIRTVKDFYFSPASDRLAFLGKEGNWYMLKLTTSQVQPVTMDGGTRLLWNGWSSDGFYFSFYESLERKIGNTYIIGTIP
jgi:hypothetical protein